MHSSVHWSIIYNSQDIEATKGLINRSKDEEDRVHIYWNICESESVSHSVMSYSLWPQGLYPARLLCPWNSLGKNTGVVAISFRGSSQPRDETWVPFIASRFFAIQATREAHAGKLSSHKTRNKMKYHYLWQHCWIHRILR